MDIRCRQETKYFIKNFYGWNILCRPLKQTVQKCSMNQTAYEGFLKAEGLIKIKWKSSDTQIPFKGDI